MFSVQQKRAIADAVHRILRDTEHPELPKRGQPIRFQLHVEGAEAWSWADIQNNEAIKTPGVNPWNERQASSVTPALELRVGSAGAGYRIESVKRFVTLAEAEQALADVARLQATHEDQQ